MPKPLDVVLGMELSAEREAAIRAVGAYCADDNSMEFWNRVRRVEEICQRRHVDPQRVAWALELVSPYMSPDGEYGREAIFDSDINGLIVAVARSVA